MKQKKYLLVTLADRNYIAQAKQLFSSVYHNAGWQGDYLLLAHQIPEKELKWFRDKGILIRKYKEFKSKTHGKLSAVIFSRYYLFTPYFKKWDNIIYLDADIIVRASLDELAKVKGFAAVPDPLCLKKQLIQNYPAASTNIEKEYNLRKTAFNAGVIAFNSRIISKEIFACLQNLHKKYSKISLYDDQTILNLLFYRKWQKLPLYYNINPGMYGKKWDKNQDLALAGLHFYGLKKPWLKSSPFYKEWKSNLGKAELIDLKNRSKAKIDYSKLQIYYTDFNLKAIYKINKKIGQAGIIIKKLSPWLYKTLKSLK